MYTAAAGHIIETPVKLQDYCAAARSSCRWRRPSSLITQFITHGTACWELVSNGVRDLTQCKTVRAAGMCTRVIGVYTSRRFIRRMTAESVTVALDHSRIKPSRISLLLLKPQMSFGICRWRCPQQGCICHE